MSTPISQGEFSEANDGKPARRKARCHNFSGLDPLRSATARNVRDALPLRKGEPMVRARRGGTKVWRGGFPLVGVKEMKGRVRADPTEKGKYGRPWFVVFRMHLSRATPRRPECVRSSGQAGYSMLASGGTLCCCGQVEAVEAHEACRWLAQRCRCCREWAMDRLLWCLNVSSYTHSAAWRLGGRESSARVLR